MSDTPRTDAAETRANASTNPYSVLREHARDLERKLAEAMDRSQEDWVALTQRAERAEAENAKLRTALQRIADWGCIDAKQWDGPCASALCEVAKAALDFPKEPDHDK